MKCFFYLILVSGILISGCAESLSDSDKFFKKIEAQMRDAHFIDTIKSTPNDSLYKIVKPFLKIHYASKQRDSSDSVWFKTNEIAFKDLNQFVLNEILLYSFKKYITNEPIDIAEIKKSVIESFELRRIKKMKIESYYEGQLKSIIKWNDENCKIGDTLKISLQLTGNKNYYTIFYTQYPESLTYSDTDSLEMMCVLINKVYDREESGHLSLATDDLFNLYFGMKMIYLSNTATHNFGSKVLKINDTFKLSLESYGRRIEKIQTR